MKREALENPRIRQEEFGQFPTAMPVVDFIASMSEPLPSAPRIDPKDRHGILVKAIIEVFCSRWSPGATILGIRNTKRSLIHLNSKALAALGIKLDLATNLPDVIVHHPAKNWLLLIDAIIGTGPIDDNRRKELKDVFSGCAAG